MKNIEAFCLAFNIEKNEYPYEQTFKNLKKFCNKIWVMVAESEDDTFNLLQKIRHKYNLVLICNDELEGKDADEYIRKGKDYARETFRKFKGNGWAYLADLDEILTPQAIKIIKGLKPRDKENYWFPFINMCDKDVVYDQVYHDLVPRLFYNNENAEVIGDGFGGVNYKSYNAILLNAPILHYGFTSQKKWKEKNKLYKQVGRGMPEGTRREYVKRKIDTDDQIFIEMKVEDGKEAYKYLMRDIMKTMGRAVSNTYKGKVLK